MIRRFGVKSYPHLAIGNARAIGVKFIEGYDGSAKDRMELKQHHSAKQSKPKIACAFLAYLCCLGLIIGAIGFSNTAYASGADNGYWAGHWMRASLTSLLSGVKCFFGFDCPSAVAPAETPSIELPIPNNSQSTDGQAINKAETPVSAMFSGNQAQPTQIIQNIQPVKEIQTIRTEINNTNTVSIDEETKDKVDLILRQLDADRPHYSSGQAISLPDHLTGESLVIGDDADGNNFTVTSKGNVTANGDLTVQGNFVVAGAQTFFAASVLSASTATPLFAIDQAGAGVALRADNITLKGSIVSTGDRDTDLLIDPGGTGKLQLHSTGNYIDAGGNLTLAGGMTAASLNAGAGTVQTTGGLLGATYNGLTINSTTGILAIANEKTLTINNSLTLSGGDGKIYDFGANDLTFNTGGNTNIALPLSGTLATLDGSEVFSNKTLANSIIQGTVSAGTGLTMPAFTLNGAITGNGSLTFDAGGTDGNITLTPSGTGHTILNGEVGIGTTVPGAAVDIASGYYAPGTSPSLMIGADIGAATRTNATRKLGSIAQVPYTITNPPYLIYSGDSNSTYNRVDIGGGFLGYNAATDILFFTGSTVNTLFGAERMRINSSGNVGIGLANPEARLSIQGLTSDSSSAALSVSNASSASELYIRNDGNVGIGTTGPVAGLDVRVAKTAAGGTAKGVNFAQTLAAAANSDSLNALVISPTFADGGFTGVTHNGLIVSSGNVGIGTTSPGAKLDVAGNAYFSSGSGADGGIYIGLPGYQASILYNHNGNLNITPRSGYNTIFTAGNVGIGYADSVTGKLSVNGNVGIGTAAPAAALDIANGNYTSGGILLGADLAALTRTDSTRKYGIISMPHYTNSEERIAIISGDANGPNTAEVDIGGSSTGQNSPTLLRFFTSADAVTLVGTEQMRINSSGRVGIGTTNPTSKLSVAGDISVSNNLLIGSSILMGGKSAKAFGDSVTVGVGASDIGTTSYISLLSAATGLTFTNSAESGGMVPDQADNVYGLAVSENTLSILNLGINDERIYGVNANKLKVFRDGEAALMAWLAIPSTKKKTAQDSSIAYTGTWNTTSVYGGIGKNTTGEGTASTTVSGKAVMIASLRQNGKTASYDLSIDGINYGNYSLTPPDTVTSYLGITYTPYLVTIPNLTDGEHSVLISCHGTSGNPCYLDWIAGSGDKISSAGPTVYVANIIRQTVAGYASHGGSDANVYEYNRTIENNVALLASIGLNVVKVDAASALDPSTGLTADGIHPNDAGYVQIKNAFLTAMAATIYPRDRQMASDPIPNIKWQPSTLSFWTENGADWAEKMRLDSAGNVGIGTTSPLARLHSKESGAKTAVNYAGYLENIATNTTTDAISKYGMYITSTGSFTGSSGTATNNYGLYIDTTSGGDNNFGLAVKTIPATGSAANVYYDSATGVFYYNASSERYKSNIVPLIYDYTKVLSIDPKQWTLTSDNTLGIGVVAEDLEKLGLPELVIYNSAGLPDGIQWNRLTTYMLAVVKDQQKEIEALNLVFGPTGTISNASSTPEMASDNGIASWLANGLQSLGMALQDGVASLKGVVAGKFTGDEADIKKVQTETIQTDQMNTRQLCVSGADNEQVCLNMDQLKEMILKTGTGYSSESTFTPVQTLANGTSTDP